MLSMEAPVIQKRAILIVSIVVPIAIAILFRVHIEGYDFTFLPPIYATTNGITALLLVSALIAIKNNRRSLHETLIKICIGLSLAFLAMYIAYHMTSEPTPYGGNGILKSVYLFILVTHIVLSIVIIPLVLFTYVRASMGDFANHRKLAKYAFPAWLYVAVTGVIIYLMISPYYKL